MQETVSRRRRTRKPQKPVEKSINILMIDDHPTQLEGYQTILENVVGENLLVSRCYSFEDAYATITSGCFVPDIVFLDMHMPPYELRNIFSGEDMAAVIREIYPESRLVIITAFSETFLLYNVIKKVYPEGVMVKSDFLPVELQEAFRRVMSGEKYYTSTVREGVRELLNREKFLDSYNRQIIVLLSQGVKTKDLPFHLNISLSAIEKRKAQLRDYFCLDKGSDDQIVNEARKLGFI